MRKMIEDNLSTRNRVMALLNDAQRAELKHRHAMSRRPAQ